MPAVIFPGQEFTIEYGVALDATGQRIGTPRTMVVVALAGKRQRELAAQLDLIEGANREIAVTGTLPVASSEYDACVEALAICVGQERADALMETDLDCQLAYEIARRVYAKQALDEAEKKSAE